MIYKQNSHTEKRNDDKQDQEWMMEQIKDWILDLWKGMQYEIISWYVFPVNCHVHLVAFPVPALLAVS